MIADAEQNGLITPGKVRLYIKINISNWNNDIEHVLFCTFGTKSAMLFYEIASYSLISRVYCFREC